MGPATTESANPASTRREPSTSRDRFARRFELGGQHFPLTGDSGIYLVSLAPDLSFRWARTYTSTVLVEGSRLVVASDGTSYFGGYFGGQIVLPDRSRDADPGQDLLVLTHDADGGFRWARDYGGDWNFQAHALALDRSEDGVTVGGLYLSTMPASFGAFQLPAITFDDAMMVRIDRAGTEQWAARLRSTNFARVSALDARTDGALCRGGLFEDNLDADDDGTSISPPWAVRTRTSGSRTPLARTCGPSRCARPARTSSTTPSPSVTSAYSWRARTARSRSAPTPPGHS